MFSRPNKWEHASFGRNKRSVELARKNLGDLHCKIFMQHENKKTSSAAKKKKHYRPASVLKKKLCNVGLKISFGVISRPLPAVAFSIQSQNEICMIAIRKCSIGVYGETSFLDLDRLFFLADVDYHFFRSILVNNIFLPRRANFLPE